MILSIPFNIFLKRYAQNHMRDDIIEYYGFVNVYLKKKKRKKKKKA